MPIQANFCSGRLGFRFYGSVFWVWDEIVLDEIVIG